MTPIQGQLFDFLVKFNQFCQENDIQYSLFWGTLLGCVREKGFIAWDDDVDVIMTRENFEKFKQLAAEQKLPKNFAFEDSLFLKGCRIPKVRDKSVQITDRNAGEGIFIDIFPMDRYTSWDVKILSLAAKGLKIRDYRKKIASKTIRSIYTLLSWVPYSFFVLSRKLYCQKKLEKGSYWGIAPVCNAEHFFAEKLLDKTVLMQFETAQLPIPIGYDEILKLCYGDYMTPVDYGNQHY